MAVGVDRPGWQFERRRYPRDLQMLLHCSPEKPYWTNELALRGNVPTIAEAYRLLVDLEGRALITRVVRHDPVSWQRTILGNLVASHAPMPRS